jgi:hypothetical protein
MLRRGQVRCAADRYRARLPADLLARLDTAPELMPPPALRGGLSPAEDRALRHAEAEALAPWKAAIAQVKAATAATRRPTANAGAEAHAPARPSAATAASAAQATVQAHAPARAPAAATAETPIAVAMAGPCRPVEGGADRGRDGLNTQDGARVTDRSLEGDADVPPTASPRPAVAKEAARSTAANQARGPGRVAQPGHPATAAGQHPMHLNTAAPAANPAVQPATNPTAAAPPAQAPTAQAPTAQAHAPAGVPPIRRPAFRRQLLASTPQSNMAMLADRFGWDTIVRIVPTLDLPSRPPAATLGSGAFVSNSPSEGNLSRNRASETSGAAAALNGRTPNPIARRHAAG